MAISPLKSSCHCYRSWSLSSNTYKRTRRTRLGKLTSFCGTGLFFRRLIRESVSLCLGILKLCLLQYSSQVLVQRSQGSGCVSKYILGFCAPFETDSENYFRPCMSREPLFSYSLKQPDFFQISTQTWNWLL